MPRCIFILVLSIISVQSHRRIQPVPPPYSRHVCQNINTLVVAEPCVQNPPIVPIRCNEMIITEAAIPNTVPATIVPVIPFITELPTCPDLCFEDILKSPLGCLDPILDVYGKTTVLPVTGLPGGLPTASRAARLALSNLPGCDCNNHFLDRLCLPPPFI